MTEQEMRKGGGGKLSRSETVTVRLDPKLRYLAELAARLHRRTLSSYIEWSIEASLGNNVLSGDHNGASIKDESEYLWDVDEADRFAKLALRYPHLLTHEEQVRWKLIRENGYLWRGNYSRHSHEWTWTPDEDSLRYSELRKHWSTFCDVANGDKPASALPTWAKTNPASSSASAPGAKPAAKTGVDDMDDEIPF